MKKFRYVRLRVPYDDEISLDFLENQIDVSMSIRKLILENFKENGTGDVFSTSLSDKTEEKTEAKSQKNLEKNNKISEEKTEAKNDVEDTLRAMQGLL